MLWLYDATKKENDFLGMCVYICVNDKEHKKNRESEYYNLLVCNQYTLKTQTYLLHHCRNGNYRNFGIQESISFSQSTLYHAMLPKRGLGCACMVNGKHLSIL